jgi:hypothetical protein
MNPIWYALVPIGWWFVGWIVIATLDRNLTLCRWARSCPLGPELGVLGVTLAWPFFAPALAFYRLEKR